MNKFLSIALLVMLLVTSVLLFSTKENESELPPDSTSGKANVGGAFTLTDADGETVSDSAFRGKYMLVFFGFTRCPDICPITMATLTRTLEIMGDKANNLVPIFISVDSSHDTPAIVKDFLSNFDARIVGLAGTEENIKQVTANYKAFYSEEESGMMNHSSLLYLMDKNGEYVTHFPSDITAEALAKSLAENMQ